MDTAAALIEAIAAMVTAATAVISAWVAYKTFIKEEHIEASANRLEVFSTRKQTTELRATEDGLELHLHDIRPGRGGLQWTLSKPQVKEILREDAISISPTSRYEKCGTFAIGPKRKWLYSKRLYPEEKKLHADIKRLLEAVVES